QQQAAQWKAHSWDDIGNAERLMVYSAGILRWIADLKKWSRYERGAWHIEDEAGERMAVEMLARFDQWEAPLYSADKGGQDKSPRQKFTAWAKEQRSATRVAAAARVLRYSGRVNVTTRDFDTYPMVLNVANGVIDLRTGTLMGHDPNYLLRQQSAVAYNPDATAPLWLRFLEQMQPDKEMRD